MGLEQIKKRIQELKFPESIFSNPESVSQSVENTEDSTTLNLIMNKN